MLRVRRYGWRVVPLLLLVVLYWPGLTNWFYQDDFGWLNLRHDIHSWRDLGPALFSPKAHGNIRPLGENAYFLLFSWLFGVNALPFRICAFATEAASLVLLGSIARRLLSSRAAGFWAQILWTINPGLAAAMCWTSIYNQVLSGFFLLLALWFLMRYVESGSRRDALGHWAAFVLGLGALETNVVYPAIAAVYTILFARAYLKKIAPMFVISALYIFIHFRVAPAPGGVYALHFNVQLFDTWRTYWMWALGPSRIAAVVLTCALLGWVAWSMRARERAPLFGLAWFVVVISPYLPLSDHRMDYYLTVAVAGLAIMGAAAIVYAWRGQRTARIAVLAAVALYAGTSLPAAWRIAQWHHDRGTRVEDLVSGVAEIHATQPRKTILLDGIDSDLFWSGIVDLPFRAMEIPKVYLAPASGKTIQAPEDLLMRYILPESLALAALRDGRAVVYQNDGAMLRNVTTAYRAAAEATWKPQAARFVNLGDPEFGKYVGSGWDPCAGGYRMLRGSGSVHIGGPRGPADHLHVGVFRISHFRLKVQVDGETLPVVAASRGGELTELTLRLPGTLGGKGEIEVTLTNGETMPLKFGFVEVR